MTPIRNLAGRGARLLLAMLAGLALVALPGQPAAEAIPPGGPGPNTPGTSSSVSPRSVQPGGVIRFTVRGFPKGQTVYIKIDDGKLCSNTSHGACVYHSQKIPSSGVVNGSFRLPRNLKKGNHTLRFLAAAYVDPKNPGKGTKGFTNRSPAFTVTGGSSDSKQPSSNSTTTTTTNSASPKPGTTSSTGTVAKPESGSKAKQPATTPSAPAAEALAPGKAGAVTATVAGDAAVLTVGADYAGEWAFVYAYSEPTPLGWQLVGADGTVRVATAGLPAGEHRLAVLDADGNLLGWTTAALGAVPTATAAPTTPAPAPVAAEAGGGIGVWALSGAVLVVAAGLVVVLLRRRRAAASD